MYDEIECPYCEHSYDLCHDDGAFYNTEEKAEEEECPKCEKTFLVTPSISWHFEASKADCLNGQECKMVRGSTSLHHRLPEGTKAGRFNCESRDKEEYRNEEGVQSTFCLYYRQWFFFLHDITFITN